MVNWTEPKIDTDSGRIILNEVIIGEPDEKANFLARKLNFVFVIQFSMAGMKLGFVFEISFYSLHNVHVPIA